MFFALIISVILVDSTCGWSKPPRHCYCNSLGFTLYIRYTLLAAALLFHCIHTAKAVWKPLVCGIYSRIAAMLRLSAGFENIASTGSMPQPSSSYCRFLHYSSEGNGARVITALTNFEFLQTETHKNYWGSGSYKL